MQKFTNRPKHLRNQRRKRNRTLVRITPRLIRRDIKDRKREELHWFRVKLHRGLSQLWLAEQNSDGKPPPKRYPQSILTLMVKLH